MARPCSRNGKAALLIKAGLLVFIAAVAPQAAAERFDILIRNGTVYDGNGGAPVVADIGVRGDTIAFIGESTTADGTQVIDARGLAVAPGFIDAHNHMPDIALAAPTPFINEPMLTQGVTTVLVGPDGAMSPAQLHATFEALTRKGFGTNYACYVGHNGIRHEVMGDANRRATADEIARMATLVREGMQMGCVGLSTGLMYDPGMFSDTGEVIALAKEVAPFGGTYDSHTRDPARQMLASEAEAILIGQAAGIPAKLGHLKATGLLNKGRIGEVIRMVEAAREAGQDVVADQYPYDGAATTTLRGLFIVPGALPSAGAFLPSPLPLAKLQRALQDPAQQASIRDATEHGLNGGFSWIKAVGCGNMRVVDSREQPELLDRNLELLARERGITCYELLVAVVNKSREDLLLTLGTIDEADVRELLVRPWVMVASDGILNEQTMQSAHPRLAGTFARVLGHYSRDLGLLPLQEAIRKMTSLPADHLRLYDRGRLAAGKAADIVVFDPGRVRDRATYVDPTAPAEGVIHVLVGGQFALRDGKLTGKAPGRFVARQAAPAAPQ